ncbi:MAG: 4Fe-4S binding protein [Spirochaetaceae bacterium]|nr:4Fe-4S binding protein [Spirochaetaceae bacterium]
MEKPPKKTLLVKMIDKKMERFVPPGTQLFEPGEDSREGRHVPDVVFTYGSKKHFRRSAALLLHLIAGTIRNRSRGYKDLKKNPVKTTVRTRAEDDLFPKLEEYARSLGCFGIGYTKVPRNLVFSNYKTLSDNAIVITMAMNKVEIGKAPSMKTGKEVWRTYYSLSSIVNYLADFLREKGYATHAGSPLGGEVNYPRLAQKAGLGYIGKHGLLISPELGPSQRIAAIYTSIENLPVTDSETEPNPHAWIAEFCESCNKCVRKCPSGAIYNIKPVMKDGGPKHIDHIKCALPFSKSMGCSVCIAKCPFFLGDYEKIRKGFSNAKPTSCR